MYKVAYPMLNFMRERICFKMMPNFGFKLRYASFSLVVVYRSERGQLGGPCSTA